MTTRGSHGQVAYWWQAENPFQFLSTCFEIHKANASGEPGCGGGDGWRSASAPASAPRRARWPPPSRLSSLCTHRCGLPFGLRQALPTLTPQPTPHPFHPALPADSPAQATPRALCRTCRSTRTAPATACSTMQRWAATSPEAMPSTCAPQTGRRQGAAPASHARRTVHASTRVLGSAWCPPRLPGHHILPGGPPTNQPSTPANQPSNQPDLLMCHTLCAGRLHRDRGTGAQARERRRGGRHRRGPRSAAGHHGWGQAGGSGWHGGLARGSLCGVVAAHSTKQPRAALARTACCCLTPRRAGLAMLRCSGPQAGEADGDDERVWGHVCGRTRAGGRPRRLCCLPAGAGACGVVCHSLPAADRAAQPASGP